MTAGYAIIPYKTPWCMLSFLHALILLAGIGAVVLITKLPCLPTKAAAALLVVAGTAHLAWQAHQANYRFCADPCNPYVYAHTGTDIFNLAERIEDIAEVHPDRRNMLVKVIAAPSDYWPLPWYLRKLRHVGYWEEPPEDADAPAIITSTAMEPKVNAKLKDSYLTEFYGLRPDVLLLAYIRADLWDAFMKQRAARTKAPQK